jgi:hypothetical protein
MAKYVSGRQKDLKVGISSYSEGSTSLEVIGNVGLGTTNATSKLYVVGDGYFTGILTAKNLSIESSFSLNSLYVSGISTLAGNGDITTTGGSLYVGDDLSVSGITTSIGGFDGNLTGIASTAINIKGGLAGNIPYQSSGDNTSFINNGTPGQVLLSNGSGSPYWGDLIVASGGITVNDEGNLVGTANSIKTLDFRGSNVNVVASSGSTGIATITITDSVSYASTAGVSTALKNLRTFEITGDIIASPISFNGTSNVSLAATIQPNSVELGADTFGDYVQTITGTSNQINISGGTGEGSTPTISLPTNLVAPQDLTVSRDLEVTRNLNVNGNITIGGTTAFINVQELKIYDPDLVLGIRTDSFGNDISTDNTANHGGISVASTEGNPLINLFNPGIGESTSATYKKIMWFKQGSFAGLGTDAWLINYAVGIGSTQFPNGTRLASGSIQFTENDLTTIRNINATGIITASDFYSAGQSIINSLDSKLSGIQIQNETVPISGSYSVLNFDGDYVNVAGVGSTANITFTTPNYSYVSGIATNIKGGSTGNIPYQSSGDNTSFINNGTPGQVLLSNGSGSPYWGNVSSASGSFGGITIRDEGNLVGTANSITTLDFRGSNITVTATSGANGIATVTIPDNLVGTTLSISGMSTLGVTSTTNLTSQQLKVSGIATLGNIKISSGIVTATTGVVTYYGDGSQLTGLIANSLINIDLNQTYYPLLSPAISGTISSISVSSNSIVFNPGPNYLGIGSTTPKANLDVLGSVYVSGVTTSIGGFVGNLTGTASTSGISTSVIGGIGSITQLQVTGISTFTNGPLLVGTASSSGTESQRLQIVGGAYFSDNVGIGTTNASSKLYVVGNTYITGILTANRVYSTVYGEFTGSSISGTNIVGTSLSITGISTLGSVQISSGIVTATTGVVTYYGDGSKLSGISVSAVVDGFNTGITSSVRVLPLSYETNVFTFPSTAGKQYVIESINVANVDTSVGVGTTVNIIASIQDSTAEQTYIAYNVPIVNGGLIELLKNPMVAGPSDVIKMWATNSGYVGVNSSVEVYINYSEYTSTRYIKAYGSTVSIATTDLTTVYTSTTYPTTIQSIHLTNRTDIGDYPVSVTITNGASTTYLARDLIIPRYATVDILDRPKRVELNGKIDIKVGQTSTIDVIIAGKQIV